MAVIHLTETAIARAVKKAAEVGKRIELADKTLPGLRLRVTPAGEKTWILGARDQLGASRRFLLGHHPDMGISTAREAARKMHVAIKAGADPIAEARRTRKIGADAKLGVGTLRALLDLYGREPTDKQQAGPGHKLKSWSEYRRRIEHVFAAHLPKPLATLKAQDLQLTADSHPSAQSAAAAVRCIRPTLKWAAQRGYIGAEVAVLHPPATVARRSRVLSRDEMAALLPVLRASSRPHAAAMKIMLLTLARREEVCSARWCDVDLEGRTWRIPVTKNGESHMVPLSRQAAALLAARKPTKPAPDALVFATSTGARLDNWDREQGAVHKASSTKNWHRHDLRRTGATVLGDLGELPDIIEAALNHVSIRSSLAATYNRSRYRPQVAAALQRLADALDGIEQGGAQVVPIRGTAG